MSRAEPLTPEEKEALKQVGAQYVTDVYEVLTGTGDHAEHEQQQAGRCVRCSCGIRVQGRLTRGQ